MDDPIFRPGHGLHNLAISASGAGIRDGRAAAARPAFQPWSTPATSSSAAATTRSGWSISKSCGRFQPRKLLTEANQ